MTPKKDRKRYYVHIPEDNDVVVYGPYTLAKAKSFARIGSQRGAVRTVTRGRGGAIVRTYERGTRTFPVRDSDLDGLYALEYPARW